jgi:hypothetical protein
MYPYSDNLIEAVHGVCSALDNIESTENVAGLLEAINEACDRINGLNAAAGHVAGYLEQLLVAAKKELSEAA